MRRESSHTDTRHFRVLATCGTFEPGYRGGGPVRTVARIVDTIPAHIDLSLMTSDRDHGSPEPYPGLSGRWISRHHCRVFYLDAAGPRQWFRLWHELRAHSYDVLYVNSLWAPIYTIVPIIAARLGVIQVALVLVAPRGELSPSALSLKARKKMLFLRSWRRLLKSMDVVWHASAEMEASQIRAVCPWARIEVCPDQVALPYDPIPAVEPNEGPARLVFIGRISPMKNLELVLNALLFVSAPVEFDIFGPLEDVEYWSRCQSVVGHLPRTVNINYRGELAPSEVRQTFSAYDAFIFPTLGENFGHVIAESLSASCPVICSAETPWSQTLESGGGVVLRELTTGCLRAAIEWVAEMSPKERLDARQKAGEAFRTWRRENEDVNILEQVRVAHGRGADHRAGTPSARSLPPGQQHR
jgi:glycosyltransferase involved in cell wall biosynthesis